MAKSNAAKSSLLKFRERKTSLTNSNPVSTSSSSTSSKDVKPQAKTYLRETGINQIINEMIISTCQKYMEFNMRKRLIYYLTLVIVGSILCDMAPILIRAFVPFKTEKSSIFNQYFVKIGWFWTLILLIPFQCLTRKSIDNTIRWYDLRDLARIFIVTFIWYFSVSTFNHIERSTGKCTKYSIRSRSECLEKGWNWLGFDISGHTFILLFSNLILFEESKLINGFENFGYLLNDRDQHLKKSTNKNCNHYETYNKLLVPIRLLYISMTFLALLWDFMIFNTILHYHSFLQKAIALLWALSSWYFCYHLVFPLNLFNLISLPLRTPTKLNEQNE